MKKINRKLRKNKKGFTLVELIVVIAIIAVLAAIIVPNMIKYLENAKQSELNSTATSIYQAASAAWTDAYSNNGNTEISGTKIGEVEVTDYLSAPLKKGVTFTITGGTDGVKYVQVTDSNTNKKAIAPSWC